MHIHCGIPTWVWFCHCEETARVWLVIDVVRITLHFEENLPGGDIVVGLALEPDVG